MSQLVSFKAFLNSGRLGPLHHGLSLNEVAVLLGPPQDWIVNEDYGAAPNHWTYENLEVSFPAALHQCEWFQIKSAFLLRGDIVPAAGPLLMTLDGLSADTRASGFFSAIDDIDRVQFYISIFDRYARPVMWVDDTVELWFEEQEYDLYDAFGDYPGHAAMIRMIEEKTRISCIYFYPPTEHESSAQHRQMRQKVEHLRVTGREFLAALG